MCGNVTYQMMAAAEAPAIMTLSPLSRSHGSSLADSCREGGQLSIQFVAAAEKEEKRTLLLVDSSPKSHKERRRTTVSIIFFVWTYIAPFPTYVRIYTLFPPSTADCPPPHPHSASGEKRVLWLAFIASPSPLEKNRDTRTRKVEVFSSSFAIHSGRKIWHLHAQRIVYHCVICKN